MDDYGNAEDLEVRIYYRMPPVVMHLRSPNARLVECDGQPHPFS
jgi:hypothetical protein